MRGLVGCNRGTTRRHRVDCIGCNRHAREWPAAGVRVRGGGGCVPGPNERVPLSGGRSTPGVSWDRGQVPHRRAHRLTLVFLTVRGVLKHGRLLCRFLCRFVCPSKQIDLLKIDAVKSEWDILQGISDTDWARVRIGAGGAGRGTGMGMGQGGGAGPVGLALKQTR